MIQTIPLLQAMVGAQSPDPQDAEEESDGQKEEPYIPPPAWGSDLPLYLFPAAGTEELIGGDGRAAADTE
ncbi:MAG: hypothetical protein MUP04_00830 [Anaerolineae bacterium]|nr:hypothetical protein [Anaerolineae bacterium]